MLQKIKFGINKWDTYTMEIIMKNSNQSVQINGKTYTGKSIKLTKDGSIHIDDDVIENTGKINIVINGDVDYVVTSDGNVTANHILSGVKTSDGIVTFKFP